MRWARHIGSFLSRPWHDTTRGGRRNSPTREPAIHHPPARARAHNQPASATVERADSEQRQPAPPRPSPFAQSTAQRTADTRAGCLLANQSAPGVLHHRAQSYPNRTPAPGLLHSSLSLTDTALAVSLAQHAVHIASTAAAARRRGAVVRAWWSRHRRAALCGRWLGFSTFFAVSAAASRLSPLAWRVGEVQTKQSAPAHSPLPAWKHKSAGRCYCCCLSLPPAGQSAAQVVSSPSPPRQAVDVLGAVRTAALGAESHAGELEQSLPRRRWPASSNRPLRGSLGCVCGRTCHRYLRRSSRPLSLSQLLLPSPFSASSTKSCLLRPPYQASSQRSM